jgi:hypothetical protein
MSTKNKSKEELQAEIDFYKRGGYAEHTGAAVQVALKWGTIAFAVWCLKESITAFAGTTSTANVVVSFLGQLEVSNAIAALFGVGGTAYGYKQRKLKGDTVKRLQSRIQELESRFDKNRTSSELTQTGETNPQDSEK